MGAPTLADARRAADEIVGAGVGTVLLFGSLARGETADGSDIDLIAIYDDLGDYSDRAVRRSSLEARARRVAGCRVDVLVTDAPEWATRTSRVPCSLEARIAREAVQLADIGRHTAIRWGKDIDLPDNPTAEMQRRFLDFTSAVSRLTGHLRPSEREHRAAVDARSADLTAREDDRFAEACETAHRIVEAAAKVTYVTTLGIAPPRRHRIVELLEDQPQHVRDAFSRLAGAVDFDRFDRWHQGAWYREAREVQHFDDGYLRRHVAAANRIAEFVGDHCRDRGFDPSVMRRFREDLQDNIAALEAPLRAKREPGR